MKRMQLLEMEDQRWCPRAIRDAATDYLRFIEEITDPYGAAAPLLLTALRRAHTSRVADLGSGGGGSWPRLVCAMEESGRPVNVVLTDMLPSREALERIAASSGGRIQFHSLPVDGRSAPNDLAGFRTLFSFLHRLPPRDARSVLADAVAAREGVAAFDVVRRGPRAILLMMVSPLLVLALTPLIRPFRWSRLLLTYLIPVVPAVVLFNGVMSCLRTYTPEELRQLTNGLGDDEYVWEIGDLRMERSPIPRTYLIGVPTVTLGSVPFLSSPDRRASD